MTIGFHSGWFSLGESKMWRDSQESSGVTRIRRLLPKVAPALGDESRCEYQDGGDRAGDPVSPGVTEPGALTGHQGRGGDGGQQEDWPSAGSTPALSVSPSHPVGIFHDSPLYSDVEPRYTGVGVGVGGNSCK